MGIILGFDKQTTQTTLLALSAGIGASIGGDTASTANNAGQTQWNYLTHTQINQWAKRIKACKGDADCESRANREYISTASSQLNYLKSVCINNYNDLECNRLRQSYFAGQNTIPSFIFSSEGGLTSLRVHEINHQAEHIFAEAARNNPSNSILDNLAWDIARVGVVNGRSVGIGSRGYGVGVNSRKKDDSKPINTTPQPIAVRSTNGEYYKSNTKHTPNQPGNKPDAGVEPNNSLELFNNSYQSGKKRYSLDSNGNIHQFTYTGTGDNTWHWAGRTGKDQPEAQRLHPSKIPNDVFGNLGTTYNKVKRK